MRKLSDILMDIMHEYTEAAKLDPSDRDKDIRLSRLEKYLDEFNETTHQKIRNEIKVYDAIGGYTGMRGLHGGVK